MSKKKEKTEINSGALILAKLEEMSLDMKVVKKTNEEIKIELMKSQEEWKKEKEELKAEIYTLTERLRILESCEEARKKVEKKRNVVVTGLELKKEDPRLKDTLKKWITEKLEVDVTINDAFKIAVDKFEKPVVLVKFNSMDDKISVMRNKYKLQKTKIFVNDDLTKSEQEIQKRITEIAKRETEKGNKTKVGYQKIQLEGHWKKWSDIVKEIDLTEKQDMDQE